MKGYDILECTMIIRIGLNTYCIILFNILNSVRPGAVNTSSCATGATGTIIFHTRG